MSEQAPLTAFGLACQPGERVTGWAPIGELNSGTLVQLPVRLAVGRKPGPVVGMSAMVHGDEYNGYGVVNRLFDELDLDEVSGAFIGLPVANPLAMHANARSNQLEYERLNLNRIFPGTVDGFQIERLAYLIFEEGVRKADVWLDYHEGGRDFIARYLIVGTGEGRPEAEGLQLARWFGQGVPVNVVTLTEEKIRLGRAGAITVQAGLAGKRALGIELGGGGKLHDEYVETGVAGTRDVLRGLGLLPGSPPEPADQPEQHVVRHNIWPRPAHGGFWEQDVALGEMVEEGQPVGRVRDLFGAVTEELVAPFRSVILDIRHTATIQTGEWTVNCGRV